MPIPPDLRAVADLGAKRAMRDLTPEQLHAGAENVREALRGLDWHVHCHELSQPQHDLLCFLTARSGRWVVDVYDMRVDAPQEPIHEDSADNLADARYLANRWLLAFCPECRQSPCGCAP